MSGAAKQPADLFGNEPEAPTKKAGTRARKKNSPPPEENPLYVEVALQRPMRNSFTYRVPVELREAVQAGVRVTVPFGPRKEVGVVVAVTKETTVETKRMRQISTVLDEAPALGADLLELTRWMADYYACAWGETLGAVLPAAMKRESRRRQVLHARPAEGVGQAELDELETRFEKQHILLRTLLEASGDLELRDLLRRLQLSEAPAKTLAKKGLIVLEKRDAKLEFDVQAIKRTTAREPSAEQADAIEAIAGRALERKYGTFLLKGVTGSGKTEVYLQVIEQALAAGRGAIVLVPEIALTPQTVGRFAERFGDVAVMHSRMTDAQRLETWMRVRRGDARVVVGARSAVFAPVEDLGVIVVDEEHEPSFKQSSTPRYHGRDVAVMRAMKSGAVCVLGSATPALETLHNAREGRYELVSLSKRIGDRKLPEVQVVDMRKEQAEAKSRVLFSRALVSALGTTLAQNEQAILFLNRRGYSPVLWCQACGETMHCAQCDVALTYHRNIHRVVCHSCANEMPPPTECPTCTAPAVRQLGAGSERVEDVLEKLFPTARVKRMDSDTMLRREDYTETLGAFGAGEIDVLVGTQMIAKGLDFPGVTLVGVISADSTLHIPDYRAAERTFQLLAQVSGRAGRGDKPGRILVQTTTPEHPVILRARTHDYDGFATDEFEMRRDLGYPPFGRLIRCVFDDTDKARVDEGAHRCADLLRAKMEDEPMLRVLGPAEAPISMLRGRYRRHLLVKAGTSGEALARARWLLALWAENNQRPRMTLDVDPVEML